VNSNNAQNSESVPGGLERGVQKVPNRRYF